MDPSFPFPDGPRNYQIQAYDNWVDNQFKGIFAMATGTGKTLTSLNCLLNEYYHNGHYNAIILVPSITLLNQWYSECENFKFSELLKIGGGNEWERDLARVVSKFSWGGKADLILICTYGSFGTDKFQKYFGKISKHFILIADEAHNIAAPALKKILPNIKCDKLIGLSATPQRVYDEEGTKMLNNFFNDSPPYVFEFSIDEALAKDFLTEYKYYPVLVELSDEENAIYKKISTKLNRFFDGETGRFKDDPLVQILLLKRKSIIHKAVNKVGAFKRIIRELHDSKKLKFVFAYVPEGTVLLGDVAVKLIELYLKAANEVVPSIKANTYTNEDEDLTSILRGFTDGRIDLLLAMKMLDEGVDIPRAEVGIFCSSTGNPRQFIQRRGRLLRKHKDKTYATIFDLVVVPNSNINRDESSFNMEKKLVMKEMERVKNFADLSMNYYSSKNIIQDILSKYEINLESL